MRIGIESCAHLDVIYIPEKGGDGVLVKGLNGEDFLYYALLKQFNHVLGCATHSEVAHDSALLHPFSKVLCHCKGNTPCSGLECHAVPEALRCLDYPHSIPCDSQLNGVPGYPQCVGGDFCGVSDVVHLHHGPNILLRDAYWNHWCVLKMVCNHHGFLAVDGVSLCVGKWPAGRRPFNSVAVPDGVGTGGTDEGGINVQVTALDCPHPSSVRPYYHRMLHESVGNSPSDFTSHASSFNPCDHPVLYVFNQRLVHREKRGWGNGHVPEAHVGNLLHHHVENIIPLPGMVVEGNGHPVLKLNPLYCVPERGNKAVLSRVKDAAQSRPNPAFSLLRLGDKGACKGPVPLPVNLGWNLSAHCVNPEFRALHLHPSFLLIICFSNRLIFFLKLPKLLCKCDRLISSFKLICCCLSPVSLSITVVGKI